MAKVTKKLQKAKNRRLIYLFFATFFLSLFIVGFLIKTLSPSVDVEIGDGIDTYEEVDELDTSSGVDNRLKWIQFEDNMPGVTKPVENENTIMESGKKEKVRDNQPEVHLDLGTTNTRNQINTGSIQQAPVPSRTEVLKQYNTPITPVAPENKMTKVYIGYYSTVEQAITVQNKILNSDLNISPFVKEVSGFYVVQAGSFANKQGAQDLSGQLTSMGYPVKLVSE